MLSNLKLLFWNTQQKLPRGLFLLRMLLVLLGILGPLFYTFPLYELPGLISRANDKITEASTSDISSRSNFQIRILSFLIFLSVLIII